MLVDNLATCTEASWSEEGSVTKREVTKEDAVIRHIIARVECDRIVVVIAQDWSCWLSTLEMLGIRGVIIFAPLVHQQWFTGRSDMEWEWRSLMEFSQGEWRKEWTTGVVLASGMTQFLPQVMSKLRTHVGSFIYATDIVFSGRRARDIHREYLTMQQHRHLQYGLASVQVSHEEFAGITSAFHFLSYRNVNPAVFCTYNVLHRALVHVLNPATNSYGVEISRPAELIPSQPRRPIVENPVLHMEGLLDIHRPKSPISCRSVFKKSGWVQRIPSAMEYLRALDMPVGMDEMLCKENGIWSKLYQSVSPLIVSSILRAMWTGNGGVKEERKDNQRWTEPKLPQQAEEGRMLMDSEEVEGSAECAVPIPANAATSNPVPEARRSEIVVPAILKRVKEEHDNAKAVKADDAEVPVHLWDCAVMGRETVEVEAKALATLRQFLMRVYCCRLWREIRQHMGKSFGKGWTTRLAKDGGKPRHQHQAAVKEANFR